MAQSIAQTVAAALERAPVAHLEDIVAHGIHNITNDYHGKDQSEYDAYAAEFQLQAAEELQRKERACLQGDEDAPNFDDLALYLVADGEAAPATPATEWDGENSVLVAATSPAAAVQLAQAYDAGAIAPENMHWEGQVLACVFKRSREGVYT